MVVQDARVLSYDKIMIVAHPDDETIFGGAQLIQESGWLVICVTNGNNMQRRIEFQKVMKKVHAEFEMWEYEDKWGGDFDQLRLKSDLAEVLARKPISKVVTHNLKGEYGHTQHIAISKIVHELVDHNIYVFETSQRKLDEKVLTEKQLLLECYKSQDIEWLKPYICYETIKRVR